MSGMDLTIKGNRAWVEYIKGQPAIERWQEEPQLIVWIAIDSPHAMHGFGINLPLKEYAPDELKKLIEEEGTRQFDQMVAAFDAERKKIEELANRKQQAQEIARKVAEAAGIELLEDRR